MKSIIFTVFLLISISCYSQQTCDTGPENALQFHAIEAVVCGEISQVYMPKYTKGDPVYLNMGGKFPNHTFTIVVWGNDAKKMDIDLSKLEGRRVAVTGIIRKFDNKPQVIVKEDSQLKLVLGR